MNAALKKIAKDILDLETVETRNSDSLDFHEHAVWEIRKALEAAYEAGRDAGRRSAKTYPVRRSDGRVVNVTIPED
jgi:hypothetical protein